MTDRKTYILANYQAKTLQEMANELGEISQSVDYHCRLLGVKPITREQRCKQYIKLHPDQPAVQVARETGVTAESVKKYAKDLGIVLPRKAHEKTKPAVVETGVNISEKEYNGVHRFLADVVDGMSGDEKKEFVETWCKDVAPPIARKNRVSEPYTQSQSPFGIANGLKGIKTKI